MKHILAADIGGTNSRFAHFQVESGGSLSMASSTWMKTTEAGSFAELLQGLRRSGFSLAFDRADIAVFAVAGPVEGRVFCKPPNVAWDIDVSDGGRGLGFRRAELINDFVAQAYACLSPDGMSAELILPGRAVPGAALALVGAGTALGKAALAPDGTGGYVALASEGGHADFPFVSERELELQKFLKRETGGQVITASTVVSGKGLSLIHHFLTGKQLEPEAVAATFSSPSETLAWAAMFYGRVCRNFALEVLARGGVYIAGGVAARAPQLLTHEAFREEFRSSRTMSRILEQIPVYLVRNEESGLWGAAMVGLGRLKAPSS